MSTKSALKLYEVATKTKSRRLKGVLENLLSSRKLMMAPVVSISDNEADRANYLRSSIKLNKEELEYKYLTSRKTFGKSSAVTMQQKILIQRYFKFTDYCLENIPLKNQLNTFNAREVLDFFEGFYEKVFGPEWLSDREGFLKGYNKLVSHN